MFLSQCRTVCGLSGIAFYGKMTLDFLPQNRYVDTVRLTHSIAFIIQGMGQTQFGQLSMLLSLQEQKKTLSADVNKLEKDIKRLKGMLIERMGTSCTAVYNGLAESYTITYNPVRSAGISKDALERLKDEHPDIYDQYVTVSEWRRFHVKKAALQAA
mgnify:CR=1 FL=1